MISPDKWTAGMKTVADYAVFLGKELMDVAVTVSSFTRRTHLSPATALGELDFNLFRLGHAWFERDQ